MAMVNEVTLLKNAIQNNERAFRNKETGDVQYVLDGEVDASVWEDVMLIPNISNEAVNAVLSAEGFVQKGARLHPDSFLEAEAHEIWALAQLAPGSGIDDAVDRIKSFLANRSVKLIGDLPPGWEAVNAGEDAAMTNEANDRLRVQVRRVLPPFSGQSGLRAWSGPTLSEALAAASDDLGMSVPSEMEYTEALKADLTALSSTSNAMSNEIVTLEAKVAELEQLCDATYVAKGADAYHHATAEMERWQQDRKLAGKDPGTEGSLCDGIGWLQDRVEELESQLEQQHPR